MRLPISLITMALTLGMLTNSKLGFGQCQHTAKVENIKTSNSSVGSFKLVVTGNSAFSGVLLKSNGFTESNIESFTGRGPKSFTFSGLDYSDESFYRISIEFDGEEKFICKKKIVDVVFTNPDKHE